MTNANGAGGHELGELVEHLAVAVTRYVRHQRQGGVQVPSSLDELAALLVRCVQARPAATAVEHMWTSWSRAAGSDAAERLLVTKAEAAQLLGVSVRTIERLVSAGQLPLLHIERASRLRVADIEAYVEALIAGRTTPRRNGDEP